MKRTITALIVLVAQSHVAWSDDLQVTMEQLGRLEQQTAPIQSVSQYAGNPLLATVSEKPGESYVLNAPMNIQRVVYQKSPGELIDKDESFVTLIGPEVHHYYSQYRIYKQLFEQTRTLYGNNEKLFKNRALSEKAWLEVSQQFYTTKLIYDEYHHFFEYVSNVDEEKQSLTIAAPLKGVISFDSAKEMTIGHNLARFIPSDSIRLKINMPVDRSRVLSSVSMNGCKLEISSFSGQTDAYYQTAWSMPLDASCHANIGELISVTPYYRAQAFSVNKQSIFTWEGENYLFIKHQKAYTAIKVTFLASNDEDYIVMSDTQLSGKEALVTSVSAAQGVLMGLGE